MPLWGAVKGQYMQKVALVIHIIYIHIYIWDISEAKIDHLEILLHTCHSSCHRGLGQRQCTSEAARSEAARLDETILLLLYFMIDQGQSMCLASTEPNSIS